ncbi:hypothetical protein L6452_35267 [Arctium lappa]|uniref:Uncharacterized protein n=1 Tax=Arctium lappa TaxID=4217 RepID=A0ACB8Y6N4_ARCLA|nr:hypothetical protein L6452_35267 [Arctium lappa]
MKEKIFDFLTFIIFFLILLCVIFQVYLLRYLWWPTLEKLYGWKLVDVVCSIAGIHIWSHKEFNLWILLFIMSTKVNQMEKFLQRKHMNRSDMQIEI